MRHCFWNQETETLSWRDDWPADGEWYMLPRRMGVRWAKDGQPSGLYWTPKDMRRYADFIFSPTEHTGIISSLREQLKEHYG